MSTFSGLSLSERPTVKRLFRRKVAQPVRLRDRVQVRSTVHFLREAFRLHEQDVRVLPVSTLEWSSTTLSIGQNKLALVDVEQANAVSFLLAKSFLYERPIFTYTEFMIRASEFYYSTGNLGLSLLIAKKANDRLRNYTRSNKLLPNIARPIAPSIATFQSLTSGMVLAFVTGHEIGHLSSNDVGPLRAISEWINSTYDKNETEPGRFTEGEFYRFLKPETVQKFDADGNFCGDIILGIKFRERWQHLKALQLGEAFSDLVGLVALTNAAMEAKVEPEIAALTVLDLLEFTEMLMSLKRLLPRLPVRGQRTNVTFESTSLGFRRFMFVEAVKAMRERLIPVPDLVSGYWDKLGEASLRDLDLKNQSGDLYSVSNRSVHIARGALLVSSLGHMPEAPSEALVIEQFGPMAGNGFFLASCLKIPESWFRIDQHHDWTPELEKQTGPVGYASAICDLANIAKKKSYSEAAELIVQRQSGLDHATILELIRHPRTQISQRRLTGRWPNPVMQKL